MDALSSLMVYMLWRGKISFHRASKSIHLHATYYMVQNWIIA